MADPTTDVMTPADTASAYGGGGHQVWRRLSSDVAFWVSGSVVLLLVVIAVLPGPFASIFGNGDPRACDIRRTAEPPGAGHPFGRDLQGCDVYANVVHGARDSLVVGVVATLVALAIALVVGTVAGLRGGAVDGVLARITDVFLGFPFLLGAVVVLTAVRERSPLTVALVLAMFGWPTMARLTRASVRGVRDSDYVVAARAAGAGTWWVVRHHVLPNTLGPVLAIATVSVGGVLVAEASLTFLGIGLEAPAVSWGLQLAAAQSQFNAHPHLLVFPAVFLAVTVLALVTLGDALRDALDPRTAR